MDAQRFRDYAIGWGVIIFVLFFVLICISGWYSAWKMDYAISNAPYIYETCTSREDANFISLEIENDGENEIKDITCEITDLAGLKTAETTKIIKDLPKESSDICTFELTGEYTKPIQVEIRYNDKKFKKVVECYSEE